MTAASGPVPDGPPCERWMLKCIWRPAVASIVLGAAGYAPFTNYAVLFLYRLVPPLLWLWRIGPHCFVGWRAPLCGLLFPVYYPLPTASAILALLGSRRIRRYGLRLCALGVADRFFATAWIFCVAALLLSGVRLVEVYVGGLWSYLLW